MKQWKTAGLIALVILCLVGVGTLFFRNVDSKMKFMPKKQVAEGRAGQKIAKATPDQEIEQKDRVNKSQNVRLASIQKSHISGRLIGLNDFKGKTKIVIRANSVVENTRTIKVVGNLYPSSDGHFTSEPLANGSYKVVISGVGHSKVERFCVVRTVELKDSDKNLGEIDCFQNFIEGVVEDEKGQGLEQIQLIVDGQGPNSEATVLHEVVSTDEFGRYKFYSNMNYRLSVRVDRTFIGIDQISVPKYQLVNVPSKCVPFTIEAIQLKPVTFSFPRKLRVEKIRVYQANSLDFVARRTTRKWEKTHSKFSCTISKQQRDNGLVVYGCDRYGRVLCGRFVSVIEVESEKEVVIDKLDESITSVLEVNVKGDLPQYQLAVMIGKNEKQHITYYLNKKRRVIHYPKGFAVRFIAQRNLTINGKKRVDCPVDSSFIELVLGKKETK